MRPNPFGQKVRRASFRATCLGVLTLLTTFGVAGTAGAATQVPLGTAEPFAVLGGTTVTNTGPTILNGDMGISPGSACTGFPAPCTGGGPGVVNGTIHSANATSAGAQADLTAAYLNAAGQPVTATVGTELGGTTRFPGVYDSAAGDFGITGTLTLDGQGDPNAVFIFKTASTLVTAAGPGASTVVLINGAQSCNVFWQVGSSATLGTNSVFAGNILALTAISATTGAVVDGRLLARNAAVTLDSNTVTRARCDLAGPTVTLTRLPQRCTARDFKMRVRVSDPLGIRHTDVFLDGKRIKRSTKADFSVKIPASNLGPGKHRIRAVATDDAGNTRVRKARFQRCAPVDINFTG
jgi:hypothetical protein